MILDGKFLAQGAHKSMKVNVVKWNPSAIKEIPVKFEESTVADTPPKRSLGHARRESQVSMDQVQRP